MAYTILFVDDEPLVTEALKRALRKEPYRVLSAQSAAQGMEILARQPVDVVISDEMMPGMPGSEFLALVCRDYPETVRIILTGHANLKTAIRAIYGESGNFSISVGRDSIPTPWHRGCRVGNPTYSPVITRTY